MDKKFNEKSREIIAEYLGCKVDDVYCVWSCKTLHHIKGLFSSDVANAKGLYDEFRIDEWFLLEEVNLIPLIKQAEEI